MIKLRYLCLGSLSPYENLAAERYFTETAGRDEIILLLWQNADTIVIGRNQNCWKECRVSEFLESGGRIARRYSGGGAVYHDRGNLNFSFIAQKENYNVERQLSVIAKACGYHGINAALSGRNDILAEGAKFSGNAFFTAKTDDGGEGCCHHGCILISADTERLARYLNVSKEKLRSKGVDSVRSRVVNLSALSGDVTPQSLSKSLLKAFESVMGGKAEELRTDKDAETRIKAECEKLACDEWIYGRKLDFTDSFGKRFGWGELELCFSVSGGVVAGCSVFSDSMDPTLPEKLKAAFEGRPFSARELSAAMSDVTDKDVRADICRLLTENI